jgi:hypothetical protein
MGSIYQDFNLAKVLGAGVKHNSSACWHVIHLVNEITYTQTDTVVVHNSCTALLKVAAATPACAHYSKPYRCLSLPDPKSPEIGRVPNN